MLALRIPSNVGVTVIPPVQRIMDGLVGKDNRMDEILISWPICDPPIHIGDVDVALSHGDTERVCLLYPAGVKKFEQRNHGVCIERSETVSLA